ncbi:hypothetical protein D3C78_1065720 [compost metagenome]
MMASGRHGLVGFIKPRYCCRRRKPWQRQGDITTTTGWYGMKLFWYLALTAACIASPVLASDDLNLDMETCEPSGVISRAKAAMSPLEFWVGEHVSLEILLEGKDIAHDREMCRNMATNRNEYQECVQFNNRYWQQIHRCNLIAQQRCRSLGGRC